MPPLNTTPSRRRGFVDPAEYTTINPGRGQRVQVRTLAPADLADFHRARDPKQTPRTRPELRKR